MATEQGHTIETILSDWDEKTEGSSASIKTEITEKGVTLTATMANGDQHEIHLETHQGILKARVSCADRRTDPLNDDEIAGSVRQTAMAAFMFGPNAAVAILRDSEDHGISGIMQNYAAQETQGLGVRAHDKGISLDQLESDLLTEFEQREANLVKDNLTYEVLGYPTEAHYEKRLHTAFDNGLINRSAAMRFAKECLATYQVVKVLSSDGKDITEFRAPGLVAATNPTTGKTNLDIETAETPRRRPR